MKNPKRNLQFNKMAAGYPISAVCIVCWERFEGLPANNHDEEILNIRDAFANHDCGKKSDKPNGSDSSRWVC